jgi:hypothetical protein
MKISKFALILMFIVILIVAGCIFYFSNLPHKVAVNYMHKSAAEPYSDTVVCSLKVSGVTKFEGNTITADSAVDSRSTDLTFVDLNTNTPSIVGNLGYKAQLLKIDNGDELYLIEKTDTGNLNMFTLFRNLNIMTLSKQYNLFGMPFGMIMMGDCLDG